MSKPFDATLKFDLLLPGRLACSTGCADYPLESISADLSIVTAAVDTLTRVDCERVFDFGGRVMDEHDWSTSADWLAMWHALDWGEESDRKRRLIATGVCRRFLHLLSDSVFLRVIEWSEVIADGLIINNDDWDMWEELCEKAYDRADESGKVLQRTAGYVVGGLRNDDHKIGRAIEDAPDVFGYQAAIKAGIVTSDTSLMTARNITNHPVFLAGSNEAGGRIISDVIREVYGNPFHPASFSPSWRTDTAISLARQMYDSRDFSVMPILADALQDAGCDNADMLNHCRNPRQVHVRGCWVVDLVLGKS